MDGVHRQALFRKVSVHTTAMSTVFDGNLPDLLLFFVFVGERTRARSVQKVALLHTPAIQAVGGLAMCVLQKMEAVVWT